MTEEPPSITKEMEKDTHHLSKPQNDERSVSKPNVKKTKKTKVEKEDPYNPKLTRRLKKDIDETEEKLYVIVRHIKNVQENCLLLGEKLIEKGLIDFGRELIARGFCHDNSKFYGIEWENMAQGNNDVSDNPNAKIKLKLFNIIIVLTNIIQNHIRVALNK